MTHWWWRKQAGHRLAVWPAEVAREINLLAQPSQ
jgi:hypothetical protein